MLPLSGTGRVWCRGFESRRLHPTKDVRREIREDTLKAERRPFVVRSISCSEDLDGKQQKNMRGLRELHDSITM